ncbi:HsdM family class I SAM-dependent methyltransferase [Streptomonospora litoralis]|uniref:N-6 DNA Methylase n=1 Tax=Streptomonospora litoralis TaxID=2498135 RepID=A0A4P6Q343_9ACTN|nr:N-6 DNA methylase [Streptomonospora litoralis]QBI53661.1 N-6 DNA Methylase [Streptomonospora litoralis]
MSGRDGERAVLGAADIARLAGVRRPAVSNWRRRFADFPRPVAGSSANPLFSLAEVEHWCRDHGKPFEADAAERLWQRMLAEVDGVRTAAFLAHAGLVLTGLPADGTNLDAPGGQWTELLGAVADTVRDRPAEAEVLYERLCSRFTAARERAGVLDDGVCAAMAEIAGIEPGSAVLDPACGTGALLRAAADRGAAVLLGQDLDPAHAVMARSRLLLAGRDCATADGDTLRADAFGDRTADAVLCDPPFRDRHWGYEELEGDPRWVFGQPPRGEGELAWVQHCLARVRPGGTVVVRMPAAAAERPSGRRVRAELVSSGALRMVAELPGGDGPASAHLWVLLRPDAEDRGPGGAPVVLTVAGVRDARDLVRIWERREAPAALTGGGPDESVAAPVPAAELVAAGMDLRPGRERASDARAAASAYPKLRAELLDALSAAADLPPELFADAAAGTEETGGPGTGGRAVAELAAAGVLEVHQAPLGAQVERGPLAVLTHKDLREGRAPSGRGEEVPGRVVIRPGDVLAAAAGRAAARVAGAAEAGAALGPRLVLLRCDPEHLDAEYLAGLLTAAAADDGHRSRSSRFDPRAVRVPALPVEQQRVRAEALRRLAQTERDLARLAGLGERLAGLGRQGLFSRTLATEEAP